MTSLRLCARALGGSNAPGSRHCTHRFSSPLSPPSAAAAGASHPPPRLRFSFLRFFASCICTPLPVCAGCRVPAGVGWGRVPTLFVAVPRAPGLHMVCQCVVSPGRRRGQTVEVQILYCRPLLAHPTPRGGARCRLIVHVCSLPPTQRASSSQQRACAPLCTRVRYSCHRFAAVPMAVFLLPLPLLCVPFCVCVLCAGTGARGARGWGGAGGGGGVFLSRPLAPPTRAPRDSIPPSSTHQPLPAHPPAVATRCYERRGGAGHCHVRGGAGLRGGASCAAWRVPLPGRMLQGGHGAPPTAPQASRQFVGACCLAWRGATFVVPPCTPPLPPPSSPSCMSRPRPPPSPPAVECLPAAHSAARTCVRARVLSPQNGGRRARTVRPRI